MVRLLANVVDLMKRLEAAADASHGLPDEETVHRLRTGTRRCGALLDSLLQSPSKTSSIADDENAHKLLRQWKKLRRAAGQVRDLDVHRELVAKLKKSLAGPATQPALVNLQRQIDQLDAWLHDQRQAHAASLQQEAIQRLPRCRKLVGIVLGHVPRASAPAVGQSARSVRRRNEQPAALALQSFCSMSAASTMLDRENLHDFRKSTKEARYVAEAGADEPHAKIVGKALKRIQDAIGEWHDLDALSAEAAQALGSGGRELRERLCRQADEKLHQALDSTERARRRLLGEYLSLHLRPRNPPAS